MSLKQKYFPIGVHCEMYVNLKNRLNFQREEDIVWLKWLRVG